MRTSLLAALLLSAVPVFSQQPEPFLKGVDLYRSRTLTAEQVRKAILPFLQSYIALRAEPKKSTRKAAERLKGQMEAKIRAMAPTSYVHLTFQEYVNSAARSGYVTFDIVDAADAGVRLNFAPPPTGVAVDPDGLLATWLTYYELGDSLARKGMLTLTERPTCPGFFCLWGSRTPELAQHEQRMLAGATANQKLLREALKTEADPKKRAAAVYVLAYQKDGNAVIEAAESALRDSSPEVRGAALQVLADMATYYKAFSMDVDKVTAALDYPTVGDRARALSVVIGLADNPNYRDKVVARAGPYLLALLKLEQPSNHDLAFTLLATLSQENHARRDYASWSRWVETKTTSSTLTLEGVSTYNADH